MDQTAVAAPDLGAAPLAAPTVCQAFQRVVRQHPDRAGLRTKGGALSLTWAEVGERVKRLAAGFAGLGIGHGDTLAIMLPNNPECHLVDFATAHLGGIPFTIYNSSSPQQIEYQLRATGARVIVTQHDFLAKVLEARTGLGDQVRHVIAIDGGEGALSLDDVEAAEDPGFDFEAAWRAVDADDLVTIIFTSGTTGPPKAAQWTHRTVMAQQRALDAAVPLPAEGIVSFLPMAHAGGRITALYMALTYGATITACPDIRDLPAHIADAHPDAFFSVPRMWEKLQVAIEALLDQLPDPEQKAAAHNAIETGIRRVQALDSGDAVPAEEAAALASQHETDLKAIQPVLARIGLDRIKSAFIGGAPATPGVVRFFRAVGVPLLEAYGLTEGSLNIFNRIDEFKLGTAGRALPGVELKLGDDGELLARSELNMAGYRNQPELTAQTIDPDGWLHTGDIAVIDDEGYVKIVDRKKEIIINAAGKNMSPANIESAIKSHSSLIGQIVVIGDRRRYVTALVTLDLEAAPMYAKRLGLDGCSLRELAAEPAVIGEIQAAVDRGNTLLNRDEQVKKFTVLPQPWSADSDELTPTLKLKRRPIAEKYASQIDALYAD